MTNTLNTYLDKANLLFDALTATSPPWTESAYKNFTTSDNYWEVGCVFDSLTDFLVEAIHYSSQTKKDLASAKTFIANVSDQYDTICKAGTKNNMPHGGCWYDDYGWWGIAASKAHMPEYKRMFEDKISEYDAILNTCWNQMNTGRSDGLHQGAPNAWDTCDQKLFATCEPRVPGGVWQFDMLGEHSMLGCNALNPPCPIDILDDKGNILYPARGLGPFQLSVVNGLYFVFAQRLQKFTSIKVGDAIANEYKFLKTWLCDSTDVPGLMNFKPGSATKADESKGLIRERVSRYAGGCPVNNWSSETTWGGDQGLMLGGFSEYLNNNANDTPSNDIVSRIVDGAAEYMKDTSGVVSPWYPAGDNAPSPLEEYDYPGGTGIFMRHLLYAYKHNTAVQNNLNTDGSAIRNLLQTSADAYIERKTDEYNARDFVGFNSNGGGAIMWDTFNELATHTLAVHVLKEQGKNSF